MVSTKPTDQFATDKWIMNVFDEWFDPCPLNPDPVVDGLQIDWKDKTYVNPPYSNPLPWVRKAIEEHRKGKRIVMLLKHDSSTKWYQMLHEEGANFLMIQGRLQHLHGDNAPFPSVLVLLTGGLLLQ